MTWHFSWYDVGRFLLTIPPNALSSPFFPLFSYPFSLSLRLWGDAPALGIPASMYTVCKNELAPALGIPASMCTFCDVTVVVLQYQRDNINGTGNFGIFI